MRNVEYMHSPEKARDTAVDDEKYDVCVIEIVNGNKYVAWLIIIIIFITHMQCTQLCIKSVHSL